MATNVFHDRLMRFFRFEHVFQRVIIRAGEKKDVRSFKAPMARDHVRLYKLFRVANMRSGVDIRNRS